MARFHFVEPTKKFTMSQLLALEWDPREIRMTVASGRGRQVEIEHAFSIPCDVDATTADAAQHFGQRIAAELDARGIGRPETIVAVGRSSIELRQLQLPPAPDADLPDMVRFQATREFNELDDKWLLDFVPIEGSATTPRTVLATAIAPAILKQIEAVCGHAGLKMRRLLLRPCEAASLLVGEKSVPRGQVVLFIDPLGMEADLTAVLDGVAVFMRTTRVNGDPPPFQALLSEIRLTMAAASNQIGGRKIQSILLCGKSQAHLDLARKIEAELGISVGLFDPFQGLSLGRALSDAPLEHPGRFAPLVGMLITELKQASHAVDFLHPRRRPEAANPRKKWMIVGAVAAMLLLGWLIYSRIDHYLLASSVDELVRQSKGLDDSIVKAKKVRASTADIAKWADEEVIWLDRIYKLNQSFPTAEEAMLGQLTVGINQQGGQIELKGWVRRSEGIAKLEEGVRTHGAKLNAKSSREDSAKPSYSLSFEAAVLPDKNEKGDKP